MSASVPVQLITRSSCGLGTGNVRSSTAFTTENTAVFAPMPRPSDTTATTVNTGLRQSMRTP